MPLQDAMKFASQHDYAHARERIAAADKVQDKNPQEVSLVNQMRAYVDVRSKDDALGR